MRMVQKRTVEETWRRLGKLLDDIPPTDCSNYFANVGYSAVKTGSSLGPPELTLNDRYGAYSVEEVVLGDD